MFDAHVTDYRRWRIYLREWQEMAQGLSADVIEAAALREWRKAQP